jgi:hypothetical protein
MLSTDGSNSRANSFSDRPARTCSTIRRRYSAGYGGCVFGIALLLASLPNTLHETGSTPSIVEEELEAALGARRSQRVGLVRAGYRHGQRSRTLTTSLGPTTIAMPRARLEAADGVRREWRSRIIPRYQRRTERVDEAILGALPERD